MSSRASVATSAPLGDGSLNRSSPKIASIVGDLASALAQAVEEIFRNRRLVVKQVRSAENLLWIHCLELSLTSYQVYAMPGRPSRGTGYASRKLSPCGRFQTWIFGWVEPSAVFTDFRRFGLGRGGHTRKTVPQYPT